MKGTEFMVTVLIILLIAALLVALFSYGSSTYRSGPYGLIAVIGVVIVALLLVFELS